MRNISIILFIFLCGCQSKAPQPTIHIALTQDQQSLLIKGLDPVIMADINRDDSTGWQTLFPVYKLPADTDLKNYQPVQPGKYQLKDSLLFFTPDTAFAPQQSYFMRYYRFGANKSVWDYVKGKAKPNQTTYTDLIFKR